MLTRRKQNQGPRDNLRLVAVCPHAQRKPTVLYQLYLRAGVPAVQYRSHHAEDCVPAVATPKADKHYAPITHPRIRTLHAAGLQVTTLRQDPVILAKMAANYVPLPARILCNCTAPSAVWPHTCPPVAPAACPCSCPCSHGLGPTPLARLHAPSAPHPCCSSSCCSRCCPQRLSGVRMGFSPTPWRVCGRLPRPAPSAPAAGPVPAAAHIPVPAAAPL